METLFSVTDPAVQQNLPGEGALGLFHRYHHLHMVDQDITVLLAVLHLVVLRYAGARVHDHRDQGATALHHRRCVDAVLLYVLHHH